MIYYFGFSVIQVLCSITAKSLILPFNYLYREYRGRRTAFFTSVFNIRYCICCYLYIYIVNCLICITPKAV